MRHALANKNPFVFGFMVYESFESPTVDETGKIPMPSTTEKALGGHAMCAVGYNDTDKRFLIRNSWGTDWGMNGYGTIPYDYLTNRNLSDDFWTVIL
jgi:C1A family cysteine protease